MVKLMNKCPKSTNSIGNILILFTVMIGFYILYRYIKSLESDLKLIKNEIIDIKRNSVNNCVDDTIKNSDINALNDINNSEKQESCENIVYINDDNDDICQNDDESVKSEEIDMILKNINSEDDDDIIIDEDDQEYIKTNLILGPPPTPPPFPTPHPTPTPPQSPTQILPETTYTLPTMTEHDTDDDVEHQKDPEINTSEKEFIDENIKLKSELQLLTNDELKKILKSIGQTSKGNKNELIQRIIDCEE